MCGGLAKKSVIIGEIFFLVLLQYCISEGQLAFTEEMR